MNFKAVLQSLSDCANLVNLKIESFLFPSLSKKHNNSNLKIQIENDSWTVSMKSFFTVKYGQTELVSVQAVMIDKRNENQISVLSFSSFLEEKAYEDFEKTRHLLSCVLPFQATNAFFKENYVTLEEILIFIKGISLYSILGINSRIPRCIRSS